MNREVIIRTVFEDTKFMVPESLTLEEVLNSKHIPSNLFQAYTSKDGAVKPIPTTTLILTIPPDAQIILQCIRNTDLRDVLPQKTLFLKVDSPVTAVSEYQLGDKVCSQTIHEINSESAKLMVQDKVESFLNEHNASDTIIVGRAGGGDSNTLAHGIKNYANNNPKKRFIFYTIDFDCVWPGSAPERAVELCRHNSLEHVLLSASDIEELVEMKGSLVDLYNEYSNKFEEKTSHFFGTYLISLIGQRLCKKYGAKEYLLGYNREDLLSEMLYSVMNGQKPLGFPVRKFGDIDLLMPLWDIPKLILDACYPKYSLDNYQEREEDTSTYQRNIVYFLAHGVDGVYPNLGLSLMSGVRKIFDGDWPELECDEKTGLYVSEYAEKEKIKEVKDLLNKYL